jgi:hypothetical protein
MQIGRWQVEVSYPLHPGKQPLGEVGSAMTLDAIANGLAGRMPWDQRTDSETRYLHYDFLYCDEALKAAKRLREYGRFWIRVFKAADEGS